MDPYVLVTTVIPKFTPLYLSLLSYTWQGNGRLSAVDLSP